MDVIVIAQMDNTVDRTFESANLIYDINGIVPNVNTCGGITAQNFGDKE